MGLLLTLGIVAGSAIVFGVGMNSSAANSPTLRPMLGGMDISTPSIVAGVLGSLLLPGLMAPLAAGVAIAGAINRDAFRRVGQGLQVMALQQQVALPGAPTPPLPDPAAPSPQPAADRSGLWSWFENVFSPST